MYGKSLEMEPEASRTSSFSSSSKTIHNSIEMGPAESRAGCFCSCYGCFKCFHCFFNVFWGFAITKIFANQWKFRANLCYLNLRRFSPILHNFWLHFGSPGDNFDDILTEYHEYFRNMEKVKDNCRKFANYFFVWKRNCRKSKKSIRKEKMRQCHRKKEKI